MFIRELRQVQHSVLVLGLDGSARKLWTDVGADVSVIGAVQGRINEYLTVARHVRAADPDGVILWTPSRLGIKVSACRHAGAPMVVSHVGNPIRLSPRNRIAAEAYTALPGARNATLIPVSRHVESSYIGKSGFRHFDSHLIHNAIDLGQFPFRPVIEFSPDLRVGMIARLDPIKDHTTLLCAWKIVLSQHPDWHLELAGDGVLRSRLQELAETSGISNRVHFHGWVSDVPAVMQTWSIVVHSTTAEEGLGNSMLEAMAIGRPLVATNVGPVAEITDGGRLARLSRVGDPEDLARQLMDVVADSPRTHGQIVSARKWVEQNFTPRQMVAAYLGCLGLDAPH